MPRSKLSLPFSQACKLSEEQKRKLIECQAKRIFIEEWEVTALLDLCINSGSVDKGLAVLYEYAGYVDDLKKVVEKRSINIENVIDFVSSLNTEHGYVNVIELISTAEKASQLTIKSIHILSKWRRMQCCPRPLYVEEKSGGKWSFQFLLKDEAKRFSDALFQMLAHVNLFDLIPIVHLAVLLAPFMEYNSFLDLIKYQHKYGRSLRDASKDRTALSIDVGVLSNPENPVRRLYTSIRDVLAIEDRIAGSWDAFRTLQQQQQQQQQQSQQTSSGSPSNNSGSRYSPDLSRLFPILRLPYRNFKAPTEDLAWFVPTVPHYLQLDAVINSTHAELSAALQPPEEVASADAPSSPRDLDLDVPGAGAGENHAQSPSRPAGAALAFARSKSGILKNSPQPGSSKKLSTNKLSTAVTTEPSTMALDPPVLVANTTNSQPPLNAVPTNVLPLIENLRLDIGDVSDSNSNEDYNSKNSSNIGSDNNNNNKIEEAEMYVPSSSQHSAAQKVVGSERKRSVTMVAVPTAGPSSAGAGLREALEMRRRVTHAGTMSSASAVPARNAFSANHSMIIDDGEEEEEEEEEKDKELRNEEDIEDEAKVREKEECVDLTNTNTVGLRVETQTDDDAPHPASQHSPAPIGSSSVQPSLSGSDILSGTDVERVQDGPGLFLLNPVSLRVSTDGSFPLIIPIEIAADIATNPDIAAMAPAFHSAAQSRRSSMNSPVNSPANSSSTSQSVATLRHTSPNAAVTSPKKPSQIIRAASEGRYKTLSFDSVLEDGEMASPHGAHSRQRNISYEIIYQESPEDRLHQSQLSEQAYFYHQQQQEKQFRSSAIFQATPSPLLSRKRAQSTPVHLSAFQHSLGTPQATPFSPPVRHSPSFDALFSPLTHASGTGASNSSSDVRYNSEYPVRKVYRGRDSSPSVRSLNSARRNFSARSRESAEHAPHFMETFGMLDTLSKPFTRGESMAESQLIHIALRNMKVGGSTLIEMAARKISVWWRLVAPRKKLLRRMSLRDDCKDIVFSLIESAVTIGLGKQRRRRTLLKNGAAMRIQRMFRFWSTTILVAARRKELIQRSRVAWERLSLWGNAVLVALKIFRFVRYWQQRRLSKKVLRLNAAHVLRRTTEKYFQIRTLRRKYEEQSQHYTKLKVANMLSANHAISSTLHRERELAVACIQKCFRAFVLRQQVVQKQYADIMGTKLTYFFIRCIARRRLKIKRKRNAAAVVIQTFVRGIRTRSKILKIVRSGLLLNSLWRKHKEYVNLKSQLRRVDRPHTLVIHGIRNIAKKTINSEQIKFKVSVWWHPLLHIVSQNDVNVILQTKQPQYIFNSAAFYLVDTAVQTQNRRMSFAQGFRKLGSMMVNPYIQRGQGTLGGSAQAQEQQQPMQHLASRGVFRYSQVLVAGSTSFSSTARASIAAVFGGHNTIRNSQVPLPAITERRQSKALSVTGSPSGIPGTGAGAGAGANTPSFSTGSGKRSSFNRKESVEVMRPSALAAQLDIIHSDDEGEEEEEEEEDGDELGEGPSLKSGTGDSRKMPTRSFISKRMGVPNNAAAPAAITVDAPAAQSESGGSGGSDSDRSLSPVNEGAFGSATPSPVRKSGKSWARVSTVVKGVTPSQQQQQHTSSDLVLDTSAAVSQEGPNSFDGGASEYSNGSISPKSTQSYGSIAKAAAGLASPTSSLLLRSTLNFMAPLRGKTRTDTVPPVVEEPKMICNFHDVVVRIPGCHGNSVVKIEIFEGE